MELTGAQILLECLKREGVDVLFGYPGGAIVDIYDELTRHPEIHHYLVRHEQAALHAADGYARATGKVGTALVTSGPGATNAVTGLATAYCDSIPLVLFTGQVPTGLIGNDAFQEVDITGITRPCTKHNYLVKDVRDLATTIRQAFFLARSGRPGPVLVDLPKDVQTSKTEFVWPESVYMRSYNPTYQPNIGQLHKAVEEIKKASNPVILAGGGVILSNASSAVTEMAESLHIPVTCSLMGIGCFPAKDPLWLGMCGMHGAYAANMALNNADLIICVGARFDDRVTGKLSGFAPHARVVHIDIDPTSIRKNVRVDVPVVGDCRLAVEGINEISRNKFSGQDMASRHAQWIETIGEWKREQPLTYAKGDKYLKPQHVVRVLNEITGGNAIITTEVGQNQMWAAQYIRHAKSRGFITSGGLGTMGFGYGAAIGAQMALGRDQRVVMFTGDGSFHMNLNEACTAVSYELPIITVIFNNQVLGMVRQWQTAFYGKRFSQTDPHRKTNFVKLAEGFGLKGYHCENLAQFQEAFADALKQKGPTWIECMIDKDEKVLPMIPGGGDINDIIMK